MTVWIPENMTYAPAGDGEVAGNWTNEGTFTSGDYTVTFNGTSVITDSGTGAFNNVTVDVSSGLTLGDVIDARGNVTISSAAGFDAAGYNIAVGGNWVNGGSFTSGTNTVTFDGTVLQTITTGGGGDTQDFNNVTISNADDSVKILSNAIDMDGTLTIDANAVFDIAGMNCAANALQNSGTFRLLGTETVALASMNYDAGTYDY